MTGEVGVIDVAKKAGVSLGTVSNVLNRPERVAPATRARVLAAIEELGFIRNEAARQLRAGRSRSIGLVVLDIRNPFFTDLAAGVESSVAQAGLSLVLCNSGDDATREDHYLSLLQEQRASGILITPAARAISPIEKVRRRGMPLVLVDRSSNRRQCSVSVDDLVGGELAVDHLISLGHKRITFIGGPLSTKQVADRLLGAKTAADRVGIPITIMETVGPVFNAGRLMGEQIAAMPAKHRPTAVFCVNDLVALGVLQEMTRHHIAVPEDLAIVGYDDIDFAGAAAVPLTSVRQPREDLGRTAADLLIEEVLSAESHNHRQVVFSPDLVVRASTVLP